MNWDNLRVFLAVAQETSVKKAATLLGMNRSTVQRRIAALEQELDAQLFERMRNGYHTTPAGDEVLRHAVTIEEATNEIGMHVAGQNQSLSGSLRVALSGPLAAYVLMPEFSAFNSTYPNINLEILTTYGMPDIDRREADVAIRVSNDPPEDLVGRRVLTVASAVYVGREYLDDLDSAWSGEASDTAMGWIGWSLEQSNLQFSPNANLRDLPTSAVVTDPFATVKALQCGMGISMLPCYIGDSESGLCRVPPGEIQRQKDLWVLTHRDLRKTARIRQFTDFIVDALAGHRGLLEGNYEKY